MLNKKDAAVDLAIGQAEAEDAFSTFYGTNYQAALRLIRYRTDAEVDPEALDPNAECDIKIDVHVCCGVSPLLRARSSCLRTGATAAALSLPGPLV